MVTMWEAGASQRAIGKAMGFDQPTVSKLILQSGHTPVRRLSSARGEKNGNWKGGRILLHGYPAVRLEPKSSYSSMEVRSGYALEHRLVMAQALGRPLTPTETVHHINGDITDARLENLQLRQGRHGKGIVLKCADCGSENVVTAALEPVIRDQLALRMN